VKHIDEGDLRRLMDEPGEFSGAQHEHAASCPQCAGVAAQLRENAQLAAAAFEGAAHADPSRARARLARELAAPRRARWYFPAAVTAAAAFALALAFTPLGGYASAFLTLFQPREFVPIDITQADVRRLSVAPQADQLGTLAVIRRQTRTAFSTLEAARAHAGFDARVPSHVPTSVASSRTFTVATPGEYVYTFSASKARAFESRSHRRLPPMPPGLNGTTVRVRVGQAFVAQYGTNRNAKDDDMHEGLTLVEMQIPTVSSRGASFQELERYMLALPGISPDLAMQLRALGDLQNRMPVPVNISKQSAQSVTVDGVQGLAIGDNTGLGAGVMWQKGGIVYGLMGGAMTMDQVLALANDLH